MKLKIQKKLLEKFLNKTAKAINAKSLNNILVGVHFILENEKLTITASEIDVSIRISVDTDNINIIGMTDGEFLVKHKLLHSAVKKCQSDYINLETIDNKLLKLKSRNINYEFNLMSSEFYPSIAFKESDDYLTFLRTDLESIIKQVCFAASVNNQRVILNGVNFRSYEGNFFVTGTNSHRLAQKKMDIKTKKDFSVIIVSKVLIDIFPLIEDEKFEIHFLDDLVLFKTTNCLIQIRLLDGIYPNANDIFPSGYTSKVFVNKSDLMATLERALVLSQAHKTIVSFSADSERILIEANENEIGRFSEEITEFDFEGTETKILLDCKYLLDGLHAFGDNKISIMFNGASKPVLFEDKATNCRYVILPIKFT